MIERHGDRPRIVESPGFARRLLELFLPAKLTEFILGDLEEEFRIRVDSPTGLRGAKRWYWRQTVMCLLLRKPPQNVSYEKPTEGRNGAGIILQDLKYGVRILCKKPGIMLATVLTLALGIGANTAIFSIISGVILKPLPFKDPDRIVTLWENNIKDGISRDDVSPANFLDWRERQQVFEMMATSNPWSLDYMGSGEPEAWQNALVSYGFFELLGVDALHGRTFTKDEYEPGKNNVVVLSYGLWKRKFGGNKGIIGRTLLLDGKPVQVVGVMSPAFRLYLHTQESEAFQPQIAEEDWKNQRRETRLKVIGRLKPGTSLIQAQAAMNTIASQLVQEHPHTNHQIGVSVVPLREHFIGNVRLALFILLGAAAMVLLIGCANIANLQLARAGERQREIAIRLAIGANCTRIVQQLFIESLVLSACGCALGLLIAKWGIRILITMNPTHIPRLESATLDVSVLSFTAFLSLFSTILFGLVPGLFYSRLDLQHSLKEGAKAFHAAGTGRTQLRKTLAILQISISIVLLIGTGLLIRSLMNLQQVDPGFGKSGVVILQVFIWDRYPKPEDRFHFIQEVLMRMRNVPGVSGAGATTAVPFLASSRDFSLAITVEGQPVPRGQEQTAFVTVATEDYFRVMGIPLLRGRLFHQDDHGNGPPVAIINTAMARRLNLGEDPIGKRIQFQSKGAIETMEIAGVVGSLRHEGLDSDLRPEFFLPYGKSPSGSLIFVVRTSVDPHGLVPSLKSCVWNVNKSQPFYRVVTVDQLVQTSLAERWFQLFLLGTFAALALLLCTIGIYGLVSFIMSQRTNEIGIRMALGAQQYDIFMMIGRSGFRLAVTGILAGVLCAFLFTRYLSTLLFEIRPLDPFTYIAVSAILLAVVMIACLFPARRATLLDPLTALRHE